MRRNVRLVWLAVLAAVALALAACGRDEEEGGGDPGIDDESIKLGGTTPSAARRPPTAPSLSGRGPTSSS